MIARIRKLNEDDLPALEQYDCDSAKIVLEEIKTNEDYSIYGIFLDLDNLVGFCALSSAEENYTCYKYYTKESKAISELYLKEDYNKITTLYCDLLDFVLHDKDNMEKIIYFDNVINLDKEYYDHLGFELINDGILVRVPIQLNTNEEENE